MIHVDVEQGSKAWIDARLGKPTSSNFHKIVTKKGALSSQSVDYACKLIAEEILGYSLDEYVSEFMERGTELEQKAVDYYQFQTGVEVSEVGFCLTDDRKVGASPDRLVGKRGLLEIKCPGSEGVHVRNILGDVDEKHKPQTQGQVWVCERDWVDILSFHPEMPPALVRVERDEEYIGLLKEHIGGRFVEQLKGLKEAAEKKIGGSVNLTF